MDIDVRAHNRRAWNRQVEQGNPWTVPVSSAVVAAARQGQWELYVTPTRPVPRAWFPALETCEVLCLASGGGQQGPILAAAGARVTVLDNSPAQLAQDRQVAERDSLEIHTVEGDMADLGAFAAGSFDLIVHPVSNCYTPDARRVWLEAARILRPRGVLIAGFNNPALYIFDAMAMARGALVVKHRLPYSDVDQLSEAQRQVYITAGEPFEFSHTLEDQLGGQMAAGLVLTGLYEDRNGPETHHGLETYMPIYLATRAVKAVP